MIWACERCRRHCCEVYPKEDKTIIFKGLCKECYKKRLSQMRENANIEQTLTSSKNKEKYLPVIIPVIPTVQKEV